MDISVERIREAASRYEELANLTVKYKRAKSEIDRCNRGTYMIGTISLFLFIGVLMSLIAAVVACFLLMVRYGMIYDSLGQPELSDTLYDQWLESLPKLSSSVFLMVLVILIPLLFFIAIRNAKKGLRIAAEKNVTCETTLKQFMKTNIDILNILPKNYRYPLAANFIAEVLESGRADTMKEALNLYEEQLHRWRMENKMNKLIEEQKKSFTTIWYL